MAVKQSIIEVPPHDPWPHAISSPRFGTMHEARVRPRETKPGWHSLLTFLAVLRRSEGIDRWPSWHSSVPRPPEAYRVYGHPGWHRLSNKLTSSHDTLTKVHPLHHLFPSLAFPSHPPDNIIHCRHHFPAKFPTSFRTITRSTLCHKSQINQRQATWTFRVYEYTNSVAERFSVTSLKIRTKILELKIRSPRTVRAESSICRPIHPERISGDRQRNDEGRRERQRQEGDSCAKKGGPKRSFSGGVVGKRVREKEKERKKEKKNDRPGSKI